MISNSSMIRRQNVALIFIGLAFSSLGYYLLLRSQFIHVQPTAASPQSGLIYPLSSRDTNHFLSAKQATELGILKYVFAATFVLGVLLTRQATQTVRLVIAGFFFVTEGVSPYRSETLKRSSGKDRTEFNGSPPFFFATAIVSFAVFWFSTSAVAALLVVRGIVLTP